MSNTWEVDTSRREMAQNFFRRAAARRRLTPPCPDGIVRVINVNYIPGCDERAILISGRDRIVVPMATARRFNH